MDQYFYTKSNQLVQGVIVLIFISVGSYYIAVIKQANRDKHSENLNGRHKALFCFAFNKKSTNIY